MDELIEIEDCKEIKVITSRVEVIQNRISDLISKIEEMKIEQGLTSRSVRQWKKETKEKYSHMLAGMKHPILSGPRPFRARAYFWRGGGEVKRLIHYIVVKKSLFNQQASI